MIPRAPKAIASASGMLARRRMRKARRTVLRVGGATGRPSSSLSAVSRISSTSAQAPARPPISTHAAMNAPAAAMRAMKAGETRPKANEMSAGATTSAIPDGVGRTTIGRSRAKIPPRARNPASPMGHVTGRSRTASAAATRDPRHDERAVMDREETMESGESRPEPAWEPARPPSVAMQPLHGPAKAGQHQLGKLRRGQRRLAYGLPLERRPDRERAAPRPRGVFRRNDRRQPHGQAAVLLADEPRQRTRDRRSQPRERRI